MGFENFSSNNYENNNSKLSSGVLETGFKLDTYTVQGNEEGLSLTEDLSNIVLELLKRNDFPTDSIVGIKSALGKVIEKKNITINKGDVIRIEQDDPSQIWLYINGDSFRINSTMSENQEILINNEVLNTDEAIENLGLKSDETIVLGALRYIDNQIENYDVDIIIKRESESSTYYFKVGDNMLNIGLDSNGIVQYGEYLESLLNTDNKLGLIGGIEWRAIKENGLLSRNRLVNVGNPTGKAIDFYKEENNKIEELYKFIQTVKGVNESDWDISEPIINGSSPIGIN